MVATGLTRLCLAGGLLAGALGLSPGSALTGDPAPCRVEAKPWRFTGFPIVAWWGPPGTASRADFEAYRDAGFTLHATNPDRGFQRALEHLQAVGLPALVFRQHQGFALEALTDPEFPADREGVVGWIVADEPAGPPAIARAVRAVNDLMCADPTRWAFFNLAPPHLQREPPTDTIVDAAVRAGMPVLSYDSYVIMHDGRDHADRFYAQLEQFRRASRRHGVPFWAFALTIEHYAYRRPSESDLRWQHYSNLAYGAKGLWYFTYWAPRGWSRWDERAIVDAGGARTEVYEWAQALNHAVLEMGDLLLGLTSLEVVHSRPPAGQQSFVPGRTWIADLTARDALVGFFEGPGGAAYALVVNKLHGKGKSAAETADTIELTFGDGVGRVDAVSWLDGVPGLLTPRGGTVSLTLRGGTGVLLRADVGAGGSW